MTKLSFFLAALVGSAIAAPSTPLVTEAPKADVANFKRASSCTFSGANGAAQASSLRLPAPPSSSSRVPPPGATRSGLVLCGRSLERRSLSTVPVPPSTLAVPDITFSGGLCSSGHGLSIGSVGNRANNVVDTVKFLNSQVTKSTQAIRVKTFKGATGQVKRITHSDITISKASKYGILIEQNYDGGDLHGEPTSTLPITGLTLKNIYGQGAVNSKGTNIAIVCGSSGCSNWTWSIVKVSGGKNYSSCQNVPSVAICKA
ncbi:hypothetical protein ACJZ2D_000875 [Fusarium nematophilum]